MLHHLSATPSIVNQYIAELRNVEVQGDRMRFRRNLERIAEILAYELSKEMHYEKTFVTTPLGTAVTVLPTQKPVVAAILRAGLPMQTGVMNVFDHAEAAFVSAYRKHNDDGTFEIAVQYVACPSLENRILIVTDPMLATGASAAKAVAFLSAYGKPSAVHFVFTIAAKEGIAYLQNALPEAHIWVAAIDDTLNLNAYIVPGLGDAGDLAYGEKTQR
jgi:uracil phosphoribosyltransferase